MGFVLDAKNHKDVRWLVKEGDNFYAIARRLAAESGKPITVEGKQSAAIPDLLALKPKSPETQPYSIIAEQLSKGNNIAPEKLQVGSVLNIPDQFDFQQGQFPELKSLILQSNVQETPRNNATKPETDSISSNRYGNQFLRKGMKSNEVLTLQKDLKTLSWFLAEPTGYFGTITENALKNFQKKNDLKPDGIVGPATKKALILALSEGPDNP